MIWTISRTLTDCRDSSIEPSDTLCLRDVLCRVEHMAVVHHASAHVLLHAGLDGINLTTQCQCERLGTQNQQTAEGSGTQRNRGCRNQTTKITPREQHTGSAKTHRNSGRPYRKHEDVLRDSSCGSGDHGLVRGEIRVEFELVGHCHHYRSDKQGQDKAEEG